MYATNQEEYWKNRVEPFWLTVWPQLRDRATPGIAVSLARLSIAAGAQFPAALAAVRSWLRPIDDLNPVVHRLHGAALCHRFPGDALQLLAEIVDDQPWGALELGKCLDVIVQADPALAQDPTYQRLRTYARRRGG